jgi:hypothetical protein
VSTDVYAGRGSPTSFAAVRLVGETRCDRRINDWDSTRNGAIRAPLRIFTKY